MNFFKLKNMILFTFIMENLRIEITRSHRGLVAATTIGRDEYVSCCMPFATCMTPDQFAEMHEKFPPTIHMGSEIILSYDVLSTLRLTFVMKRKRLTELQILERRIAKLEEEVLNLQTGMLVARGSVAAR